jgi:two-component system, LuxR family, response regulator FixJ
MSKAGLVHVIDDDDAVRDSLAMLLSSAGLATHAYPSAEAFLEGLDGLEPGCVVTDVQMPEMSGLELLQRLSGRTQDFPVIVLTGLADVAMAVEALKNGASDFIEKPFDGAILLTAVQTALARLSENQARTGALADQAQRFAALSARERDVLTGVVAGASNKEIARTLGISPRTVESYRANIMMKTQAASLSELVRMVLATGAPAAQI